MKKQLRTLLVISLAMLLSFSGISGKIFADEIEGEAQIENTNAPQLMDEVQGVEEEVTQPLEQKVSGLVINELASTLEVGSTANYQLYFTLTGVGQVYENVILNVNLPNEVDQNNIIFNQDLNELAMRGVVPTYDAIAKVLTYSFGNIEGGFESSVIVKLETRNGAPLNDLGLVVSASLHENGQQLQQDSAAIIMKSQQNASISNKYKGLLVDGEIKPISSLNQNSDGVFGIGLSVSRFTTGSLELNESSNVIFTYTLGKGMTYVSDSSGVIPTQDGSTYTWEIPVTDNSNEEYYFLKNFDLVIHVDNSNTLFDKLETTASAKFTYADATLKDVNAVATTMIVPDESSDLDPYKDGGAYTSIFGGPANNVGAAGSTNNLDITVNDSAVLGWKMYLTSLTAISPTDGLNSYDAFFNPDQNINIDKIYSGDFYFRPNSMYANGELLPMEEQINISLSVRYTGSSEWVRLVERLEPSTMYTAEQLGLDPNKKVESMWFHLHDGTNHIFVDEITEYPEFWAKLPAGITSPNLWFYTSVDKGYVGSIKSTAGIAYSGWNTDHYLNHRYSDDVPADLIATTDYSRMEDGYQSRLAPKTAQVVKEPEGISRYVKGNAYLTKGHNNIISSGENSLNFDIINDAASLNPMAGPFKAYALVDNGIEIPNVDLATGGTVKIINSDFLGQGKSLVELSYTQDQILMNKVIRVSIPVVVKENASYQLNVALLGFLNEDFEVASTSNVDGSITIKEKDIYDLNNNGDIEEMIFSTKNKYTYKNAYEYVASSLVGNSTMGQSVVVDKTNNKVNMELHIENIKNNPIKNFILMDVLPSVNDTNVLSDEARNSKFDVRLNGEIVLPSKYKESFDVFYSTSSEPVVKDVLDVNVDSNLAKLEATTLVDDAAWQHFDEIQDKTTIKSFKIVMKDNVKPIREKDLTFTIPLIIADNALTGEESLEDRISYNTYAVAVNDASVIESSQVSFIYEKETIKKYSVTFESNGGTHIDPITEVLENSLITKPANPIKDGYTFEGWYSDESLSQAWDFESSRVVSDTILYAKWKEAQVEDKYTVTFESNGGTNVDPLLDIISGSLIQKPGNPTRLGYTFVGWYKEATLDNVWNFDLDHVESNMTLYAKWMKDSVVEDKYTVTFESNGGTSVASIKAVIKGSTISEPTSPTKDGYTFEGWFKDEQLTNVWNFASDTVMDNMTLYAKWTKDSVVEDKYTVTFESNGGTSVASIKDIVKGSTISEPASPTKDGYTFNGWFKDEQLTNAWNFTSDTVMDNMTLYAKWTKDSVVEDKYTVTFESNGGTSVASIKDIVKGSTISEPTKPTKDGYVFKGWFKDIELSNAWNFEIDTVNSDVTLYAKWEKVSPIVDPVKYKDDKDSKIKTGVSQDIVPFITAGLLASSIALVLVIKKKKEYQD